MSHTDKTDPFHVKGSQQARERHNHIKGYCDLPPRGKHGTLPEKRWTPKGCYWDYNWWHPMFRCSCEMCSTGMKEEGRRLRYSASRQIREQLADMVEPEEHCKCECHYGDDCCYLCTNDYANYCDQELK